MIWMLWWDVTIQNIIKFIHGLGHIIPCKHRQELWEARKKLEEARVFLEEDLHNIFLYEKVVCME